MATATAPAVTRKILGQRFDAAMEERPGAEPFKPTDLGEAVLWNVVRLVVRTAPDGELGVRAYASCEETAALYEIMTDLRATVVRHVEKAIAR